MLIGASTYILYKVSGQCTEQESKGGGWEHQFESKIYSINHIRGALHNVNTGLPVWSNDWDNILIGLSPPLTGPACCQQLAVHGQYVMAR